MLRLRNALVVASRTGWCSDCEDRRTRPLGVGPSGFHAEIARCRLERPSLPFWGLRKGPFSEVSPGRCSISGERYEKAVLMELFLGVSGFKVMGDPSLLRCSDFQRWGGKDSYDQLPDDESLNCQIGNANAAAPQLSRGPGDVLQRC